MPKQRKGIVSSNLPFSYCTHLQSFSLSHTPSVNTVSSQRRCTASEPQHFDWLRASDVTRLPIHTSPTSPMCQSTSAARDQLVRSGVFNQTRHNSRCVTYVWQTADQRGEHQHQHGSFNTPQKQFTLRQTRVTESGDACTQPIYFYPMKNICIWMETNKDVMNLTCSWVININQINLDFQHVLASWVFKVNNYKGHILDFIQIFHPLHVNKSHFIV